MMRGTFLLLVVAVLLKPVSERILDRFGPEAGQPTAKTRVRCLRSVHIHQAHPTLVETGVIGLLSLFVAIVVALPILAGQETAVASKPPVGRFSRVGRR